MLVLPTDEFLVLGHRGASAYAGENTVEAFRRAARQGAHGVELDVRMTADSTLIVHHDAHLPSGRAINVMTQDELRSAAPHVPSLAEAMDACSGLIVNLEIKNDPADPDYDPDDRVAEALVRWVAENDRASSVIISSFNPRTVMRARALAQDIAVAQLIAHDGSLHQALAQASERGLQAVHAPVSLLIDAAPLAEEANERGLWLIAWTVDDEPTIRALRDAGLTGIITNDPARAVRALR